MTDTNATQPARRRPRRRGRPSLLTPTVMDLLTRATAVGLPMTQAADAAGVGRSTFLRWMSEGEDLVEEKQGGQLDELLDEEDARQRARETPMERALTPHLQDLAERLQKTLAQYQEEDGTPEPRS